MEGPSRGGRGRGTYIPSEDPAEKPTLRRFGTFIEIGSNSPKKGEMREVGDGGRDSLEKSNHRAKTSDILTMVAKIALKEKFKIIQPDSHTIASTQSPMRGKFTDITNDNYLHQGSTTSRNLLPPSQEFQF